MQKTLYMLIGPKGSGKTYIGKLVERETDMTFLRVEKIWLGLQTGEDGWQKVEQAIDQAFETCSKLMIESLGAGEDFQRFLESLRLKYAIKMIRVYAEPDVCLDRVHSRNSQDHIPVSDDKVIEYNKIASQVQFYWDVQIDNNGPASDAVILEAIKNLHS